MRPRRLRVGPYAWPAIDSLAQDRTDPPTTMLPVVRSRRATAGRESLLLLTSAAVGLGVTLAWAVVTNLLVHPRVPAAFRVRAAFRSLGGAFVDAVLNAAVTSVLEECGIAVLILAVAGVAQRFLPARLDSRTVGVVAIVTGTVVRTALHIPLWGTGAVARIALSFALAWLFWRTRRIWPLITAHVLWDTLVLQTATSPSPVARGWRALAVLAWGITALVLTIIATNRSRKNVGLAVLYYRRPTDD